MKCRVEKIGDCGLLQAVKHLEAAAKKLTDPGQLKMCQDELARLQK
jgi:hypothetical protein